MWRRGTRSKPPSSKTIKISSGRDRYKQEREGGRDTREEGERGPPPLCRFMFDLNIRVAPSAAYYADRRDSFHPFENTPLMIWSQSPQTPKHTQAHSPTHCSMLYHAISEPKRNCSPPDLCRHWLIFTTCGDAKKKQLKTSDFAVSVANNIHNVRMNTVLRRQLTTAKN